MRRTGATGATGGAGGDGAGADPYQAEADERIPDAVGSAAASAERPGTRARRSSNGGG